jgi:hypothetical protein
LTSSNILLLRSAVIPVLIAGGINAYNLWTEHWEHWAHMPPLEERTEYPYQNIRVKNFPWGDGDKVRPDILLSCNANLSADDFISFSRPSCKFLTPEISSVGHNSTVNNNDAF